MVGIYIFLFSIFYMIFWIVNDLFSSAGKIFNSLDILLRINAVNNFKISILKSRDHIGVYMITICFDINALVALILTHLFPMVIAAAPNLFFKASMI